MTEPLEPYIRTALISIGKTPRAPIFRASSNSPQVADDKANHIVLYVGAFNPPHVGHLELLLHVLQHKLDELNIVAAVVYASDDEGVRRKNEERNERFVITQEDRCTLWNEDVRFPENAFTFRGSRTQWQAFGRGLVEHAAKTGIQIRFVVLFGAEYMRKEGLLNLPSRSQDIVYFDIARSNADFPSSNPPQIPGFSDWTLISNEITRQGMPVRSEAFTQYPGPQSISAVLWRCVPVEEHDRRIYFVACTGDVEPRIREGGVSSTRIRQVLQEERGSELVSAISAIALCPHLLLSKITSGVVDMKLGQQQSVKTSLTL